MALTAVVVSNPVASAQDINAPEQVTPYWNVHDHDLPTSFRLHEPTLDTAQRQQIIDMMQEWEAETQMDFSMSSNSTHPSPETAWETAGNLIWEGIPPVTFVEVFDCLAPEFGLACTVPQEDVNGHINEGGAGVDMIFYERIEWQNYGSTNACLQAQENRPLDPREAESDDIDQKSVALHESGHWISLLDNFDSTSIMFRSYAVEPQKELGFQCQWQVFADDARRATTHYDRVGH